MGDENPIRSLGDYFKLSHEGYMNTIELPERNNEVPLRSTPSGWCKMDAHSMEFGLRIQANILTRSISTWEDLTTRFLAQFFPSRRTTKLRNDILMFQQHQRESLSEAWTRFMDLLQKVPHHGIYLWLQVQIFYDHIDQHLKRTIDYAAGGRLRKISEAFKGLVMNFILEQEEMVKQLKEYIEVIGNEFMQLSLKVVEKLKEFLATHGLVREFFDSINTDPFTGPQWANLFQIHEPVYHELVREFFASFEFKSTSCRYNSAHVGVSFRIGGETRNMSLLDWNGGMVLTMRFWLSIGDGEFVVGGTAVKKLRDLKVSVEPRAHIFIKKSLIAMNVMLDLGRGACCWPTTRTVEEDNEVEEAANEEAGGSAKVYRNMNHGDWQVRQARKQENFSWKTNVKFSQFVETASENSATPSGFSNDRVIFDEKKLGSS
nr:zinc finger, CCHC-type [Tanacetum cinerariifolium]